MESFIKVILCFFLEQRSRHPTPSRFVVRTHPETSFPSDSPSRATKTGVPAAPSPLRCFRGSHPHREHNTASCNDDCCQRRSKVECRRNSRWQFVQVSDDAKWPLIFRKHVLMIHLSVRARAPLQVLLRRCTASPHHLLPHKGGGIP